MSTAPIRFDRLQAAVVASVRAALPSAVVSWEPGIPDGITGETFARVRVVSGFDSSTAGGESRPTFLLPATATLQVTGPCRVWISGMWWEGLDRDDLLAQLDALPLLSATYAAAGADSIAFAAPSPGDLVNLQAAGLAAWTVNTTAQAEVLVESVSGVCSIDLFSRERSPRAGAHAQLSSWRSSAQKTPGRELLDRYGFALGGTPIRITPLDEIAGERWDSRARATFTLTTLSVDASTTTPPIETAVVGVELRDAAAIVTSFEIP